jgi:hypothetical protein
MALGGQQGDAGGVIRCGASVLFAEFCGWRWRASRASLNGSHSWRLEIILSASSSQAGPWPLPLVRAISRLHPG